MSSSERTETLVAVTVHGRPAHDWWGRPRNLFRRAIGKLARFCADHPRVVDAANAVGGMAARKIEGEASAKYASAVRDFATAESVKIEAELARRTLEAKVAQEEALAQKAAVDLFNAKLELFERLRKCGYVPVQIGPNEFKMQRVIGAFTEQELEAFRLVAKDGDDEPTEPTARISA